MELIENLLQLLTTFVGALLSGISYRKSRRQAYFLLLCFYGCFALGALYWTLYLLLFDTTPRVFYVSEFGWVASVIFLHILQATLTGTNERSFRCRRAWLALAFGVPLLAFYCTFGDILSNLIWCGMMIWLSFCAIRALAYAKTQTGAVCLVLLIGASLAMPGIVVKIQTGDYSGFETTASIFHSGVALGYIVIGLLAFLLGVCVTVLCFRLRQMNREDGQDKESEDEHGAD